MNKSGSFIIVDSSGLVSLRSIEDTNHYRAVNGLENGSLLSGKNPRLIVPADVFTETVNILGKKFGYQKAYAAAEFIIQSEMFNIIESSEELRSKALDKFRHQSGGVSLTDCIVMSAADYFNTKSIFGFDEHFSKAGYTVLE